MSAASARGTHGPARCSRRHPAYQTIAVVAPTWAAVHSQPATPNGTHASGIARMAAKGG
ncbi:hypothetical protein D3C83_89930 [compost metagenome]